MLLSTSSKSAKLLPSVSLGYVTMPVEIVCRTVIDINGVKLWCDLITELTAGKKVALSIFTKGQNRMFKITVPKTKAITCYTTGSSSTKGDPDLYVKFIT